MFRRVGRYLPNTCQKSMQCPTRSYRPGPGRGEHFDDSSDEATHLIAGYTTPSKQGRSFSDTSVMLPALGKGRNLLENVTFD